MQPYFFPYLGYFALIAQTGRWIVFDVVQYNAKSWMNRNRILHPHNGWQYVSIPVHHAPKGTPIHDMRIVDVEAVSNRILGQLRHYGRHAPHYDAVTALVRASFARAASGRLLDLNVATLAVTCEYLGIPFNWSLCSDMGLELGDVEHAGQWALRIATQVGADTYINPPRGRGIFRPEEWRAAGVALRFIEHHPLRYDCRPYEYVEDLSILDVLMWNRPDAVAEILRNYVHVE